MIRQMLAVGDQPAEEYIALAVAESAAIRLKTRSSMGWASFWWLHCPTSLNWAISTRIAVARLA